MISSELWYLEPIRNAISAPSVEAPESLREAAAAYDEACRDINRRLREAARLLRGGLRSEAIQLAEIEPQLLTLVGEFDVVHEDWQGMLAQWGMELPPDLELELAAELNAAYAELQPLESLLRKHRLLALARAPLPARIVVLRQLAQIDALSESWQSDLVSYETQRIRQIGGEIRGAARVHDAGRLTALRDELQSGDWAVAPPLELQSEVEMLCRQQARRVAGESIAKLASDLNQSYMEFDRPRATSLAKQWRAQLAIAELSADDPAVQEAAPALEWVDSENEAIARQSRFEASVQRLEQALDAHVARADMETLLHQAERFELPIPELLLRRVRERSETQRLLARRKGLLVGAASVLLAAGLLAGAGVYWWRSGEAERFAAQVSQLKQLAGEEKWRQLLARVEKLDAGAAQRPEIASLVSDAEQHVRLEEDRTREVETMLGEAEAMQPLAVPPEKLAILRKEVRSTQEKRRLATIESGIRQARASEQAKLDQAFEAVVKSWSDRIATIENGGALDRIDFYGLLAELDAELQQHNRISASMRSLAEPLRNKLRALHAERDSRAELDAASRNLSRAIASPTGFESALTELARNFGDELEGIHAKQVLEQKQDWNTIASWSRFWQQYRQAGDRMNADLAVQVMQRGDALTESISKCDLATQFQVHRSYLEHLIARKGVDLDALKSHLTEGKLIRELWVVQEVRGQRAYYCREEPVEDDAGLAFAFVGADGSLTRQKRPKDNFKWGVAPQSKCAESIAKIFAEDPVQDWDQRFVKLADTILSAAVPDDASTLAMDPVLATKMLAEVLSAGKKGSFLLDKAFSPLHKELMGSGADLTVYWHLPGDPEADLARRSAGAALAQLRTAEESYGAAAEKYGEVCKPPATIPVWLGVASLDRGGDWRCLPPLPENLEGTLSVASRGATNTVSLVEVGAVSKGRVTWNRSGPSESLLNGQPLFFSQIQPQR